MAQNVGIVYVEVAPSATDFGKKLEGDITDGIDKSAQKGGVKLTGVLGKAFGTIGKAGLGAVGTIAGGITALAAKGGFTRALNIENAQAKLKGLGHDASSVSEIMSDALASVKGTAFGLGDAATVAATLSASGVKEGEQLTNVLKTVADTAQISGRELTDVGTIFGSVAARGKLQGDDMLQLMSSGVPVLQLLAQHLGKTSEEVSDMVSSGEIDFQTFADAMQEGLGGSALAAGDTFTGALANVKAALGRLGEGPGNVALESLRRLFNAAIPAIDAFSTRLDPLVDELSERFQPVVDKAVGLVERFAAGLEDGSVTIQDVAGDVGQLAGAFALFAGIGGNMDAITGMLDAIGSAGDSGFSTLAGKAKALPGQLQSGLSGLQQFKAYFDKDLRDALAVDGDPFANAVNRIRKGAGQVTAPIKDLGSKLSGTAFGQKVSGMASGLSTGFGKLTSAADSNLKAFGVKLSDGFSGAFGRIGDSQLAAGISTIAGKAKTAMGPVASGMGDVLGGIGEAVGPKVQAGLGKVGNLFTSFFSPGNFVKYMGVAGIVAALVAGLGMLDSSMQGQITGMIASISARAPEMLNQLNAQITGMLPGLIAQGAGIIASLMNAIGENAPELMTTAVLIVTTLVNGLAAQLPMLVPTALSMVMALVAGLASNTGQLIESGLNLLLGLVQGLMNALPQLIAQAPTIIGNLASSIGAHLPQIISTGIQILTTLAAGLVSAIPQLIAQIPAIIGRLKNAFTSTDWGAVGLNIIRGIADGVKNAAGQLVDAAVGAAEDALNWVKSKLGIHSPSRVFRDQVGVMIGRGMAEGITDSRGVVNSSLDEIARGLTLDGYAFGAPAPSATGAAARYAQDADTAAGDTDAQLLAELLDELKALHEDLPYILQQMGINVDGREFGRLVRKYAVA